MISASVNDIKNNNSFVISSGENIEIKNHIRRLELIINTSIIDNSCFDVSSDGSDND
jgi:hypothetical protein